MRIHRLAVLSLAIACNSSDEGTTPTTTDVTTAPDVAVGDDTTATTDPGALLALSMTSTVGVLLDEIPEAARQRVIDDLLAKPTTYWEQRAHKQIETTSYRLVFRNLYFEPEEGKGILPLPPVETWKVVLAGPAEVRTIDGHSLVAVDYTFTSTLLGPAHDAVNADARLTGPGTSVEESFVLPVDPEHILERTGYACMNEADFPPNSVDTENARSFYDHDCAGGVLVEADGCHLSYPVPDESCVDALKNHVGSVETTVRFERLAWDASVADAARVGSQIPDVAELRAMPEGVAENRLVYRYFAPDSCAISEGCVGAAGWRRLLQFTATVQNLGAKDSAIGDVSEGSAPVLNRMVSLSECHGHMHFNHYGKFTYGDGDQHLGSKRAFCLESTWRYYNNEDTPFHHPYTCQFQGTAAGWGDDYIAGLDCQWVDVTTIDTSSAPYTSDLGFHVNADKFLCEGTPKTDASGAVLFEETEFKNEAGETESRIACNETEGAADNNTVTSSVTLPQGTGGLVTSECKRGQLGPKRNCGFKAPDAVTACTPGAKVVLGCNGASATRPVAVRVCEASGKLGALPCTYLEALGTGTAADGEVTVEFTCPAARDAAAGEPGGTVGVYVAPLITGDPAVLTCAVK